MKSNCNSGMESDFISFNHGFFTEYHGDLNRLRRKNVLMYKGGSPAMCSLSPKTTQIVFLLIRVNPSLSVSQLYFSFCLYPFAFILLPISFRLCP